MTIPGISKRFEQRFQVSISGRLRRWIAGIGHH
jgi:hypothetical protein